MKAIALLLCAPLAAQVQPDKVIHFAAGSAAALVVESYAVQHNWKHPKLAGVCAAVLAGALKEAYDSRKGGTGWDNKDLAATALGGVVVSVSWRF